MPGFRDGHIHPLWGGVELGQAPLVGARSIAEIVDRVRSYAEANPALEWIEGGGYDPSLLPAGIGEATTLDAAVRDRPVVLEASDHHTMWVNSEALRRAGIDAATPDPPLGRILRRGDGSPIGTLVEWDALALMRRHIPPATLEERQDGLARRDRASWPAPASPGCKRRRQRSTTSTSTRLLARSGGLTSRVNIALRAEPGRWTRDRDGFGQRRDALAEADDSK